MTEILEKSGNFMGGKKVGTLYSTMSNKNANMAWTDKFSREISSQKDVQ